MLGDLSLRDLIIKDPITVSPDDDIEIAAQLIYNHKIGGMPVAEGGILVGIITATDILRTFIDMMGILTGSSRIDVVMKNEPGALKEALQIINDGGGAIIAPFVVAVMHLPVYTIAGAALFGTFVTSIAGVAFYQLVAPSYAATGLAVAPDWLLGALFGRKLGSARNVGRATTAARGAGRTARDSPL